MPSPQPCSIRSRSPPRSTSTSSGSPEAEDTMFIELSDLLRCTEPHEDMPGVAAVAAMSGRHVVDGTLGCHGCGARYAIRGGIADFGEPASEPPPVVEPPSSEDVIRLAAYLDLTEQ